MLSKEDPLEQMYYFRAIDWLRGNILLNRLISFSILLVIWCIGIFNLYHVREDKLYINLVIEIGFSPVLSTILVYSFTVAYLVKLRSDAEEKYRRLRSEGPETYDRITHSSRSVTVWLWGCFAFNLFTSIFLNSLRELRDLYGVYDLMGGYGVLEGLMAAFILVMWTFPMNVISQQVRWNHWIWAQMVLLEGHIRSGLGTRIRRDDKGEQERCRRCLRDVARFHSDIKSIADYYYRNVMRIGTVLIFPPGACAVATSFLLFFTDLSVHVKLAMVLTLINTSLFLYITVRTTQSTIDESERLCEALYDCPWYDWDKSNCTTLIVVMSVMKEPVLKTNIFGVLELNYKAILKMFRMSYGFIAAVLNLK